MDYDTQYRVQYAGALQRPASTMSSPGLIWHRAFWKPSGITENVWHRNVDYFLFLLFMHVRAKAESEGVLKSNFAAPNFDEDTSLLYCFRNRVVVNAKSEIWRTELQVLAATPQDEIFVRHNVFTICTLLRGLRITVRATSHTEYWTLSILCDLSEIDPEKLQDDSDEKALCQLHQEIRDFVENRFRNRWESAAGEGSSKQTIPGGIRKAHVETFEHIVSDLMLDCCKTCFPHEKEYSLERVGGIFAEFHGDVFGIETGDLANAEESKKPPLLGCLGIGDARDERPYPFVIGNTVLSQRVSLHIVDAFWPIIEALHRNEPYEALYGKPEYSASLFQDRRSIYISSLGRLRMRARARLEREPVVYTLIVSYRARGQLGRMVERINTLGTLRLAALRDLDKLSAASNEMKALEHKISRLAAGASASSIAQEFKSLGRGFDEGLMYRVDRSRYYVGQYVELMKQLRSDRVEGFQKYEEFVRRKLFDTFDFIDRLGKRYVELRSEVQLLLDSERTEKAISLQDSMQTFLDSINLRQGVTNTLLENAEWFIAAPIAYYAGMGLHYLSILFERPISEGWGIAVGIVVYVTLIGGLRLFRSKHKE